MWSSFLGACAGAALASLAYDVTTHYRARVIEREKREAEGWEWTRAFANLNGDPQVGVVLPDDAVWFNDPPDLLPRTDGPIEPV